MRYAACTHSSLVVWAEIRWIGRSFSGAAVRGTLTALERYSRTSNGWPVVVSLGCHFFWFRWVSSDSVIIARPRGPMRPIADSSTYEVAVVVCLSSPQSLLLQYVLSIWRPLSLFSTGSHAALLAATGHGLVTEPCIPKHPAHAQQH